MKPFSLAFKVAFFLSVGALSSCKEGFSILVPSAPSSLERLNPISEYSADPTPTITVFGVESGEMVKVFTDSSCTSEIGSARAFSTSVDITISVPLNPGRYRFYASSSNNFRTSPCSSVGLDYSYFKLFQLGKDTKAYANGSSESVDWCHAVTVDPSGYIYCAGLTLGDLGEPNSESVDAFVMKLDPNGGIVWLTQLGSVTKANSNSQNTSQDICRGVAVDSIGNVYCAGSTKGALSESSGGGLDAFVMKLAPNGAILWVTQLGAATKADANGYPGGTNSGTDYCYSVAVDKSGHVYCAGSTTGSMSGPNAGGYDAFVMKLDPNGAIVWHTQLDAVTKAKSYSSNDQDDSCYSVAVDDSGNVYCAGRTKGSMGEVSGGGSDAFIMKLGPTGDLVWLTQLGEVTKTDANNANKGDDYCMGVAVDNSGQVYCAGTTGGNMGEENAGSFDAFIMKLGPNGNLLWLTQLGALTKAHANGSNVGLEACQGVALDQTGNVYCAGYTWGSLIEENGGNSDLFILKLDSNGNVSWSFQLGAVTNAGGSNSEEELCLGVAVDGQGHIYCAGYTRGSMGTEQNGNYGIPDVLVLKL